MMGPTDFLDGIEASVSMCDEKGITTYMNARAAKGFAAQGGYALLGKDMRDCHPSGEVLAKFEALLASQELNAYTIERDGQRKLIYQVPVFHEGAFKGYAEFALPIPWELPHFVRK
jgi:transcriptional regulator with PAS, ATPase and Fis domain